MKKILSEMGEIQKVLKPIPEQPRLFTQDATPETIGLLLAAHGEKQAAFSAEGGLIDLIAGRYSNNVPNLDVFLQAHSGDAVRVDRIGREPVFLHEPALTIGICPQPVILNSMASKSGFRSRGLIARFLYAMPVSNIGQRTLEPKPLSEWLEMEWRSIINSLLNFPGSQSPISMSPQAYCRWKRFQRDIELEMAPGGDLVHMMDFGGKLPGAAARIAGLYHCAVFAKNQPTGQQVSDDIMARAVSLADKLKKHARAAFDYMGADPEIEAARRVLLWIVENNHCNFTLRGCHRALYGTFNKRDQLLPALNILMERNYIRLSTQESPTGPGRRSMTYEVNPETVIKGNKSHGY